MATSSGYGAASGPASGPASGFNIIGSNTKSVH
jgi:hypothetical protein